MINTSPRGLIGLSAEDIRLILRSFDVVEEVDGTSTDLMDILTYRLMEVLEDIRVIQNDRRLDLLSDDDPTMEISRR
jgi:hypothetical protein